MGNADKAGTVWTMPLGQFERGRTKLLTQLDTNGAAVFQRLGDDPDYCYRVAKAMVDGLQDCKKPQLSLDQVTAQRIMGENFLGVEEVTRHFKVRFTEKQLAALAEVPYDEATLRACKDTHILFPGYPITIVQMRARMPMGAFNMPKGAVKSYKDVWYNDEAFARKDKVEARWYLLRKEAVSNSFGKYYDDQRALLSASETVPRACEVVFGTMLFFAVRGVKLFQTYYVRTVSLSGAGVRFGVGYFGGFGLGSHSWHDNAYYDVGLASSVKALC